MLPEPLIATNAPAPLETCESGARVYTGWTGIGEGFLSRRELNSDWQQGRRPAVGLHKSGHTEQEYKLGVMAAFVTSALRGRQRRIRTSRSSLATGYVANLRACWDI